jgi:biotin transporter BioY
MKKMLLLLAALVIDVSQASAQAPYFQGKTIGFVVGYPPAARMTCGRDWSDLI